MSKIWNFQTWRSKHGRMQKSYARLLPEWALDDKSLCLLLNFSVKYLVKNLVINSKMSFPGEIVRKRVPQKSTTCFTLKIFKFNHRKHLGPLLQKKYGEELKCEQKSAKTSKWKSVPQSVKERKGMKIWNQVWNNQGLELPKKCVFQSGSCQNWE